jgi:pimeloyl-ACP methyl ester carboxylesterase
MSRAGFVGSRVRRAAGIAGAAAGVVTAGAAVGLAAERFLVGRPLRRAGELVDAEQPLGRLRGEPVKVLAPDDVELYAEVDDRPDAELTVVFSHGYTLNQDCWHFQREALREHARLVFWDQRSHGRSGRGSRASATVEQTGHDLLAVLEATAPTGPVVLVGHSMGGMTVLAAAQAKPELFGDRVVGVALIGASAGDWSTVTLGLPGYGARTLHWLAPGLLGALGRWPTLVERGRRAGSDLSNLMTRWYAFGSDVPTEVVRFAAQMIERTPIDVVADFYPSLNRHEQHAALSVVGRVEGLVLVGARDLIAPVAHSEAIAAAMPAATLVVLPDAGHLVILERPEIVNQHLRALLERVGRAHVSPVADAPDHGRQKTKPARRGRRQEGPA